MPYRDRAACDRPSARSEFKASLCVLAFMLDPRMTTGLAIVYVIMTDCIYLFENVNVNKREKHTEKSGRKREGEKFSRGRERKLWPAVLCDDVPASMYEWTGHWCSVRARSFCATYQGRIILKISYYWRTIMYGVKVLLNSVGHLAGTGLVKRAVCVTMAIITEEPSKLGTMANFQESLTCFTGRIRCLIFILWKIFTQ